MFLSVFSQKVIRKVAAEAIEVLTGAHDKDTLFSILDKMGITGGLYHSKEDEVGPVEEFLYQIFMASLFQLSTKQS